MNLMARYLPHYQFAEEHSRHVAASAAAVLDAASRPEVLEDPIARRLIALRELPARVFARLGCDSALRQRRAFGAHDFVPLGRDSDREIAFGLAGRFWRADYGLVAVTDAQDFLALDPTGLAKLVLNFTVHPEGDGVRLTTRTRVWCRDRGARRRFSGYWLLIRPASGLIRRRLLRRIGAAACAPRP